MEEGNQNHHGDEVAEEPKDPVSTMVDAIEGIAKAHAKLAILEMLKASDEDRAPAEAELVLHKSILSGILITSNQQAQTEIRALIQAQLR